MLGFLVLNQDFLVIKLTIAIPKKESQKIIWHEMFVFGNIQKLVKLPIITHSREQFYEKFENGWYARVLYDQTHDCST